MDPQWLLPFPPLLLYFRAHMVLGSPPKRWQACRTLGVGNSFIHSCPSNGPRQSRPRDEHMDEIYFPRHPRQHDHMARLHRRLRHRRSQTRLLNRIRRCHSSPLLFSHLLPYGRRATRHLPPPRLRMEIRETHVPPPNLSSCPRDPEIQHSRLPAQNGAIPKGD